MEACAQEYTYAVKPVGASSWGGRGGPQAVGWASLYQLESIMCELETLRARRLRQTCKLVSLA